MTNWLRKGLDKYEDRHQRREDRCADLSLQGLDALSDQKTLKKFLYILGGVNILIWVSAILFPLDVFRAFGKVMDVSDRIGMIVLGLLFGLGIWITYSLLRLRFPDIEDQKLDTEVFGSYARQTHANKRWFVWLFSVIGGVVNLFGVIFVVLLFTGN